MKKLFFAIFLLMFSTKIACGQDASYNNLTTNTFTKFGGYNNIFGWGLANDNTTDPRPGWRLDAQPYMINHHTGLTLSAHSAYGGIRFYNQGYPNPYDPSTGAVMVMSIMNGNVGIGTTTPASDLSIARNGTGVSITTLGSGYFGCIALNRESATGAIFNSTGSAFQINNGNGSDKNLHVQVYSGSGTQINQDALTINGTTSSVGINTTDTKGYQFAVNGSAIATSMTVKLQSAWPDFVFKKDYQLPSLTKVKAYIDQNRHLPDLPSEQEIIKDGINLGEMNKLLTKKVEELTLYIIDQNKQLADQKKINQSLQDQINDLSNAMKNQSSK